MSNNSKRSTLLKCNTMKAPKQLRKTKSFLSQGETFQIMNDNSMEIDQKLKKLEKSFQAASDQKLIQTQQRYNKTFSTGRKTNTYSVYETIIPDWMKTRKDFQKICYTQTIDDLLTVPKIILKQQRNQIEDQIIREWIQKKISGLPEELYKSICSIIQIKIYDFEEVFDLDHNIAILYEGKIQRIHKELGFPITGQQIKIGEFLSDEFMYLVKCETIIIEIPKIELMQILEGYKISRIDAFTLQMKQNKAFALIKKHSLHKIISRGQLQLIIPNFEKNQRTSNADYLNVLFHGTLSLRLRKRISKINKWPTGNHQWESKEYFMFIDKVIDLQKNDCYGLTNDQYTIQPKNSCLLLTIRKLILETIISVEQIQDLTQQIDLFKNETNLQKKERMRKIFDQELFQQKIKMEKVMMALLND